MNLPRHSTPKSDGAVGIDRVLAGIENIVAAGRAIPIIGPVKGRILYLITKIHQPSNVLELGTAVGYSTLIIARAVMGYGRILTVERDPDLAREAAKNIEDAGVSDAVEILVDDAAEALASLRERFDMIFLDIEKRYYTLVLDSCVEHLNPGGVLIADNVMWDELREFRNRILSHKDLESAIIPVEDGLSLSIRA
jgi:predicted O-methyltransferase YrrM